MNNKWNSRNRKIKHVKLSKVFTNFLFKYNR